MATVPDSDYEIDEFSEDKSSVYLIDKFGQLSWFVRDLFVDETVVIDGDSYGFYQYLGDVK